MLAPGNVYRRDFFDASHAPMFAQIEGLCVDEGISFVDLKATLDHFAERFFGAARDALPPVASSRSPSRPPRWTSSAGSATAPAARRARAPAGWRSSGSGMVHPAVLEAAGVDSEKYTGWAFGMGPARIAQQRYGIRDIRVLYDSDVRFLEQIAE